MESPLCPPPALEVEHIVDFRRTLLPSYLGIPRLSSVSL